MSTDRHDEEVIERLERLGCPFAQGRHLAPPAPAAEAMRRTTLGEIVRAA